jgi:oxygen-independent coproporphyrinogen-3 oxidase
MGDVPASLLRKYAVPGPRYTSYPTVPYWDHMPTEAEWVEHLRRAFAEDGDRRGASLYVHIPFCHSLCTYCGCNMRVTRNHALVPPYVAALLREQALLLQRLGREGLHWGEVHLGGGTPTYLHPEELDSLLTGLFAQATFAPGASRSLEADPRTTTAAQLEVLRRHGFNRLSLGVQDFDPRVQDIVNRVQDESQVRRVTEDARRLGFESISYDLIYGLPLQTVESVQHTFDAVLRQRPDRIAFYAYAHVPWIKPSQRRFTEADLPDGETRRELYETGRDRLLGAGYVEIGMDHFALPGDALQVAAATGTLHRNFMGYTHAFTRPVVGLGVSSIGDAGTAFAQNEKNLQQYQERIARDELPLQRGHVLNDEDRVLRGHILALMTRFATSWEDPAARTPFLDEIPGRLAELAADGLVELEPHGVRVTTLGRAFLRNICMAFDARLLRKAPGLPLFSATV